MVPAINMTRQFHLNLQSPSNEMPLTIRREHNSFGGTAFKQEATETSNIIFYATTS